MTNREFINQLKSAKKVAIFGHVDPDPDAYGAMFAVRELCTNFGNVADCFAIQGPVGYLDEIFPLTELKTEFKAEEYDLVVFVDMHMYKRLARCFVEEVQKANNILILDHHTITGEEIIISDNYIIDSKSAASCELLAQILLENGIEISEQLATYLWTGLVGDTGRFLHGNTDEGVFQIAIELLKSGAKMSFVYDKMFRSMPLYQLKLEKVFIDKIKLVAGGKAGYVIFTQKDLKKNGVDKQDVKMFTDLIQTVKGIELSFLAIEIEKNRFKFSLRTNSADCRSLAVRMNGGGHKCAAAFVIDAKLSEIKKKIPVWAEEILK